MALLLCHKSSWAYNKPSKVIGDIVNAPRRPAISVSPDGKWIALFSRPSLPNIEEVAEPELRLAGLRIDPNTFFSSRTSGYNGISIQNLTNNKKFEINLPEKVRVHAPEWSPDSRYLAFLQKNDKLRLRVFAVGSQKMSDVSSSPINGSLNREPFRWHPDSKKIFALTVLDQDAKPKQNRKLQPIIQTAEGVKAPARTYQDLLKSPQDEATFMRFGTSQIKIFTFEGEEKVFSKPKLFTELSLSPDGRQLLVTSFAKPFLYSKPFSSFANSTNVIDLQSEKSLQISANRAAKVVPQGYDSVRLGKRNIHWHPNEKSTVVWVEAHGDGSLREKSKNDIVYSWAYPFNKKKKKIIALDWRFAKMDWSQKSHAFVTEWRFFDRNLREWLLFPDSDKSPLVLQKRSYNDQYKDPGTLATTQTAAVHEVVMMGKKSYYRFGLGASPEGRIPFIDRISLKKNTKERIWQSSKGFYEQIFTIVDQDSKKAIVSSESPTTPANIFLLDVKAKTKDALTDLPHPYPYFKNIKKERVSYKRKDGVELSGDLYLPEGYKSSDGPLPTVLWAYPLEFKDKAVAAQIKTSPYQFKNVSYYGPLPFLAKGYAVFDDPKMPIVGEKDGRPNDTFIKQLIMNAEAAIDTLVKKGVTDPEKVAIGGHSYGAFMVAILLAHSDLFKTGIARSGTYNRSLTPFGFQG